MRSISLKERKDRVQKTGLTERCCLEPIENTRYLFVDAFQKARIQNGEKPAERAVFRKQHGVARGLLTVADTCPRLWRVGLWAGGPYDVWARWSSDAPPDTPDQKNNTLGLGLKLFGVSGPTLALDDPVATTADLIFQNSDIFFVDNIQEMCAISADFDGFTKDHPRSAEILKEMAKVEHSLLTARYSSSHPYAIGDAIVKFRLRADLAPGAEPLPPSPNYLADDLGRRLAASAFDFHLEAQAFVDPGSTPVDRATVRWEETVAPFSPVATLTFPAQNIGAPGQSALGERLAFSPWRTLHENRPLGSIADGRRIAYPSSAALRRSLNGQPMREPDHF